MSKALRLSEKWFHRGLWLVALVFASFLIGLGGTLVGDLPRVEAPLELEQFMDQQAAAPLRAQAQAARQAQELGRDALEQAQLQSQKARGEAQSARASLNAWLATRSATQRSEQDPEVLVRTRALDVLEQQARQAQRAVEAQQQVLLDANQRASAATRSLDQLERDAGERLQAERRKVELRVFLYRLALTLPLLLVAGWLFVKKRHGTYWPFVWGFIWFALFAFFVELVPYLPSYGGYVRYVVGIVLTVVVGRYAIVGLNRYLERQRAAEALPDAQRRDALSYDLAQQRLAKGLCPGCERSVDLKDTGIDFCPHCGIGLFSRCSRCQTRKSAFSRFCHACGLVAAQEPAPQGLAVPASPGVEPPGRPSRGGSSL